MRRDDERDYLDHICPRGSVVTKNNSARLVVFGGVPTHVIKQIDESTKLGTGRDSEKLNSMGTSSGKQKDTW